MSLQSSVAGKPFDTPFFTGSGSMTQTADSIIRWVDEGWTVVGKTAAPKGCECVDPPVAWVPASGTTGRLAGNTAWNCEGISRLPIERNVEIFRSVKEQRPNAKLVASVLALAESKQSWEDVIGPLLPYAELFEFNVSCPQNVIERGAGAVIGRDPNLLARVVGWGKEILGPKGIPFSVKMTPMVADVGTLALVAAEAGADALTCFNTYRGNLGFDPASRKPLPAADAHQGYGTNGATSGSSIHTISLEGFRQVALALKDKFPHVSIIASGGVCDLRTALNYILFGASAVQVYSALTPGLFAQLVADLKANLEQHGNSSLEEIRGIGLPLYLTSSELVAMVGGNGADGKIPAKA